MVIADWLWRTRCTPEESHHLRSVAGTLRAESCFAGSTCYIVFHGPFYGFCIICVCGDIRKPIASAVAAAAGRFDTVFGRYIIGNFDIGDRLNDVTVCAAKFQPVYREGSSLYSIKHLKQAGILKILEKLIFNCTIDRLP